jgi:hypothetical protein
MFDNSARLILAMAFILLILLFPATADEIELLGRSEVDAKYRAAADARTYEFRPTLVLIDNSGWTKKLLINASTHSMEILGQCGIGVPTINLITLKTSEKYKDPDRSQRIDLARSISPAAKPLVFFIRSAGDVMKDAFSYGRSNTRSAELKDTVWVKSELTDIAGVALAHELIHILSNSGEHINEPGNLMNEDADTTTVKLKPDQCNNIVRLGIENGFLNPKTN